MADFRDICGGYGKNVILFYPRQKKGKKGTKKGKSGFWSKIVWKSQNPKLHKNSEISYPFYPFYPFCCKCNKITHFLSPPFLGDQNTPFRCKKVLFCEILKYWPKTVHLGPIYVQNFQIYVPFLLLDQFKNHLWSKESKHNIF